MKLNYKKIIVSIIFLLIIIVACKKNENKIESSIKNNNIIRVGIIFNEAGLLDKAFNDLCYEAMLKAQENLFIEFDYSQSKNKDDYEKLIREYAKSKNYDLIICVGAKQEKHLTKVSKEFLGQKFSIMDSELDLPNVSSIYTNWSEQTFLNGLIAGFLSLNENKGESVGVILGKNLKHLNEGAVGFEAGARYVNPDVEIVRAVVGDFSDPARAKEIALSMYNKNVNYIQQLAGESGFGVFQASKKLDKYAFGVDRNQNYIAPENIISTATRNINDIIYNEIKSVKNNTWKCGVHRFGLKENVVGYDINGSKIKLDPYIINNLEKIKKKIVNKTLKVPKTYEELEIWIKSNKYKK